VAAIAGCGRLFVRLVSGAPIVVTPHEIRESVWFGLRSRVIPWAEASHAVVVPQRLVIKGQVVYYNDLTVIHKDGVTRIKHSGTHEDPEGFINAVERYTTVYRSKSDPVAEVQPLDLDPAQPPGLEPAGSAQEHEQHHRSPPRAT
jgi:hypothetical protein